MIDSGVLLKYEKAGAIARKALLAGKELIRPGVRLLEVAEKVEAMIVGEGAGLAFPANISINADAAHYAPCFDDERVFGEKDVVKLDVGAHIDGYIGDTALCVDLSGEQGKLVEAAETGLNAAIAAMRPGATAADVGRTIEEEIRRRGFKPIENLTGHRLEQFALHGSGELPNVGRGARQMLEEGQVYAVEPFATDGAGSVCEGDFVEIFSFEEAVPVRMRESRRVMMHVERQYRTLPFAERWLRKEFTSKLLLETALRELVVSGAFRQYPVLTEVKKGLVSQAEHTVVIEKDGARVLTK